MFLNKSNVKILQYYNRNQDYLAETETASGE